MAHALGHMRKKAKSRPAPGTPSAVSKRAVLSGIVLVLLALAVYLPSWRGGFLWDDDTSVTESEIVKDAGGWWKAWVAPPPSHPDYFPLTTTTYWMEWRLWGANPVGYRAFNILLHALCVLLLWRLLREMKLPGAWWAAAIFAVHPVNVESVAWIAERKNVLAMVFAIPAFQAFVRWDTTRVAKWYWAALALFVAALAAKASVVALPVVFFAYQWWRHGRLPDRAELRAAVPFLAASFLFGILVLHFQHTRAMAEWQIPMGGMVSRTCGAAQAYWFYLSKAVWPFGLTTIYPKWSIDPLQAWQVVLAMGTALMVGGLWFTRAASLRALAWALTAYGLLLLPALGLIKMSFMRYSPVADHFQHLALPVIVATVVCGSEALLQRAGWFRKPRGVLFTAVAVILFGLSWQRAGLHSSNGLLWQDSLAKNPASGASHNVYGAWLEKMNRFAEADTHFQAAVRLSPSDPLILNDIGIFAAKQGHHQDSIGWFLKAIEANPHRSDPYLHLARSRAELEDSDGALDALKRGAEACPDNLSLVSSAAAAFFVAGRAEEALGYFQRCEVIAPDNAFVKDDMARVLSRLGRHEEAEKKLREARALDPSLGKRAP